MGNFSTNLWRAIINGFQNDTAGYAMNYDRDKRAAELHKMTMDMTPKRLEDSIFNHQTGRLNALSQLGNLGLNRERFGYQQEQDPIKRLEKQRADIGGYLNNLGDREGAAQVRAGQAPVEQVLPGATGRALRFEGQRSGTKAGAAASARLGVLRTQRMREAEGAAKSAGEEFDPTLYGNNAIPPKPSNSKDSPQERLSKEQIRLVSKMMAAQYYKALKDDDAEGAAAVVKRLGMLKELAKSGKGPLHPEDISAILESPAEDEEE